MLPTAISGALSDTLSGVCAHIHVFVCLAGYVGVAGCGCLDCSCAASHVWYFLCFPAQSLLQCDYPGLASTHTCTLKHRNVFCQYYLEGLGSIHTLKHHNVFCQYCLEGLGSIHTLKYRDLFCQCCVDGLGAYHVRLAWPGCTTCRCLQ